ncbi:hypothetical protein CR513_21033, partial [Mucuna pruriens]
MPSLWECQPFTDKGVVEYCITTAFCNLGSGHSRVIPSSQRTMDLSRTISDYNHPKNSEIYMEESGVQIWTPLLNIN